MPRDQGIFYQLFEASPDGIIVVDRNGLISQVNTQAEKMFGYARGELAGQPVEMLIPGRFASRHTGHREGYMAERRTRPMGASLDLQARRRDGSEFPVAIMLSPLESDQGSMVLAVVRDITVQKKVESDARASQELFSRLFEFAPDAIIVVNDTGQITRANAKTVELFGYSRDELTGQPVEMLIPERFSARHVGFRSSYLSSPRTRPMGAGLELYARRRDGTEFPVDIMLSPVQMEHERLVLGVVRDITERRTAEDQHHEAMRREIHLKEVHQKEIHHRVKNNLQVISSLLFLQSGYIRDPVLLEILKESQSRIRSIALIHEKLYRSNNIEKLDVADYLRDLVRDLLRTYGLSHQGVSVHEDIARVHVGVDTAIPCGLIVNELVSNAVKHAFTPGEPADLWIEFHEDHGQYELSVRDNGRGLPADFDWQHARSLGLKLVNDLTRQLEGELEVAGEGGAAFRVRFREILYRDRG